MTSSVPIKYTGNNASSQVRWALWKWFDIPSRTSPGMVYLRRLRIIQTPWFGVYLHFIYDVDADQDPHDHPWPFWSYIVRGGYHEVVYKNVRRHDSTPGQGLVRKWTRGTWHGFNMKWAHRIIMIRPGTISLVVVGRRRPSDWGFWTAAGKVPWQAYQQQYKTIDQVLGLSDDPFNS